MPRINRTPTPPRTTEKRPRTKKPPLAQASIYDFRLEDEELEHLLARRAETEAAHKEYLQNNKAIKARLQAEYPEMVVGLLEDDEDDPSEIKKGPYAVCGEWRFLATAPATPPVFAGTETRKKAKPAGHGWSFKAAKVTNGGIPLEAASAPPETETVSMIVDGSDALVERLLADAK